MLQGYVGIFMFRICIALFLPLLYFTDVFREKLISPSCKTHFPI